jgi:hypothetical protein
MTETMRLANHLEKQYPSLNFRNHCYLRIAYDNTVDAKWDTVVARPFTINASAEKVTFANYLLSLYISDKDFLMQHNKKSLTFRKKI